MSIKVLIHPQTIHNTRLWA